ncbi:hypothetical protein [Hansschlegelia sp. KR7-227]|uniref:hypothetical protein n=1 Tax=Hansschlegelia sp. KR7-227 TaxID=3400914 RepID=UPI003C0D9FC2
MTRSQRSRSRLQTSKTLSSGGPRRCAVTTVLTQSFSYLSKNFLQDKDLGATTMNEAPVNPAFPSVQKASTGAPPGVFTPSLLSAY